MKYRGFAVMPIVVEYNKDGVSERAIIPANTQVEVRAEADWQHDVQREDLVEAGMLAQALMEEMEGNG